MPFLASLDDSHARAAHPLLASLGRDLRELQRTLGSVGTSPGFETLAGARSSTTETPERENLLSWLQGDMAANRVVDPATRTLDASDRSVQVHACHGPARQVEVLREVLLGLLADPPAEGSRCWSRATSW